MTTSPLAATSSHPDTSEFIFVRYQKISLRDPEGLSPDPDPTYQVVSDMEPTLLTSVVDKLLTTDARLFEHLRIF